MIREILRADIEVAIRLRKANRSDEDIVAALARRGVDRTNAAQLVDDLRNGRNVSPQILSHLEFAPPRRSRSKPGAPPSTKPVSPPSKPSQPSPTIEEVTAKEPPGPPADGNRKRAAALRVFIAIVICSGVVFGALLISNRLHRAGNQSLAAHPKDVAAARELADAALPSQGSSRHSLPADLPAAAPAPLPGTPLNAGDSASVAAGTAKAKASYGSAPAGRESQGPTASPDRLVFDLTSDGLHIGSRLLTRGNALKTISEILGAPTRTPQGAEPDTVIHAYDTHGLLIYSHQRAGNESIVLDCEASGGNNGTTTPFTGSLRIEGQVIRAETDAQALAAIEKLGLKDPGPDGRIMSGKYNGLDLVFAYLKTPQRLSLIEIDLK
jgi:hypothetical protein